MNKELILKLLAALGVKATADGANNTLKEDDAVKLVEDLFKAETLGLAAKRDELLGSEKSLKEKIALLETSATESNKKIGELDALLKKNSPADIKAAMENEFKITKDKYEQDLAGITADRDKYRDTHFKAIQKALVEKACENIEFLDGLKNGFISRAMEGSTWTPSEMVNREGVLETGFLNQNKKTIDALIHEFKMGEGKAYIKNGSQGSGAQGGQNRQGGGTAAPNPYKKDAPNLTEQMRLERANPEMAAQLKAEADKA